MYIEVDNFYLDDLSEIGHNVIFSGRSCKLSLSHMLIFLQCYNNKNNNYLVYSTFHFQSAFAVLINPHCEV